MDDVSLHLFCVWVEQKSNKNDVVKNYNTTQHLIGHTKWFSYQLSCYHQLSRYLITAFFQFGNPGNPNPAIWQSWQSWQSMEVPW